MLLSKYIPSSDPYQTRLLLILQLHIPRYIWNGVDGLWCLMPLSTILQLYLVDETAEKTMTNFFTYVSSTPLHERDSNSQL